MKIKKIFLFFIQIACLYSLSFAEPKKIDSRNYQQLTNFIQELSSDFYAKEIGKVVGKDSEGNYNYPIYKITYTNSDFKKENKNNKHYLFLCGMHGNEPAPVFAVKQIIQEINNGKIKIPNHVKIDFIYIINPYGFERNYRYNSKHFDANRDLLTQESQEIKILTQATSDKYDLVIDFHEAACDGTFFYAYSQKGKKYSKEILSYLESKNVKLENEYIDVILRVKQGLLYSAFYAQWYMKLKNSCTTGMYYNDRKIPLVFTVETPKRAAFTERCKTIQLIFEKVINP